VYIKDMSQYRVEWCVIHNNYESVGPWHNSKEVIEAWVEYLNKKYFGEIHHRIGEK
jgi:hypothetical protein